MSARINLALFGLELSAAGIIGLDFTASSTGDVDLSRLTDEQRAAVEAVIAAHDPDKPLPPPPVVVAKVDLYRKMSDAEFDAMTEEVAKQPVRMQGIFEAATNFRSNAPEWALLQQMATKLFGAARAAELLTPATS